MTFSDNAWKMFQIITGHIKNSFFTIENILWKPSHPDAYRKNITRYLTHSWVRAVLTSFCNIQLLSTCLCNILLLSNICILCVVYGLYLPGEIINCFIVSPQGTRMLGRVSSCVHGVMIILRLSKQCDPSKNHYTKSIIWTSTWSNQILPMGALNRS